MKFLEDHGFSDEPAVYVGIADAVIVLAVSFGLPLTAEQKTAIDALLVALSGFYVRSKVTPVR